jgi:hypothetical protein
MSEQDRQRAILDLLHARGIIAHKQGGVNLFSRGGKTFHVKASSWRHGGTTGISDIAGVLPDGRALAIEVKALGKIPKTRPVPTAKKPNAAEQWDYLEAVNRAGGLAFYASTVVDVAIALTEAGY